MVLTHDTEKYGNPHFAEGNEVWYRDRLDEARSFVTQLDAQFDETPAMAAGLRRDRKRGKVAEPTMAFFITKPWKM